MIKSKKNDAELSEEKDEIFSEDTGEKPDSENTGQDDGQINNKSSKENIDYEAEIERKNKEIQSLTETMKRRQADFENYKKRMIKSQEDFRKLANKDFALDVIQINDDLLRALEAACVIKEGQTVKETCAAFSEGFMMISRRIEDVLKKYGIEEINSLGNEFDPNFNEAVEIEESGDVEKDTVTRIHQKGFRLEDYVVRCAKVKVTKSLRTGNNCKNGTGMEAAEENREKN